MDTALAKGIITEAERRIFEEGFPRIKNCLKRLTHIQLWTQMHGVIPSAGTLVLHLEGNVRQYIVSAMGNAPDVRKRAAEFDTTHFYTHEELYALMDRLEADVKKVLSSLRETDLLAEKRVQGFDETGLSILIHVTEHFSYHTGQIATITKLQTKADLGFYAGYDLNKTGAE